MNTQQAHLVRKSFAYYIERQDEIAALVFYRRLFELDPTLQTLFQADIQEQAKKLMDMLAVVLSLLDRPDDLAHELERLGSNHVDYGAKPEHYVFVRKALLDMLSEMSGEAFTPEVSEAWNELYNFIEASMLRGAAGVSPVLKRSGVNVNDRRVG